MNCLHRNRGVRPTVEFMEARLCLAAASFAEFNPLLPGAWLDLVPVEFTDFDADADHDLLAVDQGEEHADIVWLEKLVEPSPRFPNEITPLATGIPHAFDLDHDGDIDVIYSTADATVLLTNTDGQGTLVQTREFPQAHLSAVADFDGDDDPDLLLKLDDGFVWQENDAGGFVAHPAPSLDPSVIDYFPGDLDHDGDQDLLGQAPGGDNEGSGTTIWFENLDGRGSFGAASTLTDELRFVTQFAVTDVDGDTDLDIVANADGGPWLLRSVDGQFTSPERLDETFFEGGRAIAAADLDGDGDVDVVASGEQFVPLRAYLNGGDGTFEPLDLVTSDGSEVTRFSLADLNGDGDLDVLGASYDGLVRELRYYWIENLGSGAFFGPRTYTFPGAETDGFEPYVVAADLTGDGAADALHHSGWVRNDPQADTLFIRHIIATVNGRVSMTAAQPHVQRVNLDGDGNPDLLVGVGGAQIWLERSDAAARYLSQGSVAEGERAFVVDVDGDGDLDILATNRDDLPTRVYANDGLGGFSPAQTIEMIVQEVADMNADGSIDLLGLQSWSAYDPGGQSFQTPLPYPENEMMQSLLPLDVDLDGDLDLVVATENPEFPFDTEDIGWLENTDGMGSFANRQVWYSVSADFTWLSAADLDVDGDDDLFVESERDNQHGFHWSEITGSVPRSAEQLAPQILKQVGTRMYHFMVDENRSLDLFLVHRRNDVFPTDYHVALNHKPSIAGDANLDGIFNSADLVHVLQVGKYEDGVAGNATFEEGDWDLDGEFTSSDLVLALQQGNYIAEARPRTHQLAAAVEWIFAGNRTRKTVE